MDKKLRNKIKELVVEGVTESYINTVIRLDPIKWNFNMEAMELTLLLEDIQKRGIITINS